MVSTEDRPAPSLKVSLGQRPWVLALGCTLRGNDIANGSPFAFWAQGWLRRRYNRKSWGRSLSRIKGRTDSQCRHALSSPKPVSFVSLEWSFLGLGCWCVCRGVRVGRRGEELHWLLVWSVFPSKGDWESLWPLKFFCYFFHIWFLSLFPRLIL